MLLICSLESSLFLLVPSTLRDFWYLLNSLKLSFLSKFSGITSELDLFMTKSSCCIACNFSSFIFLFHLSYDEVLLWIWLRVIIIFWFWYYKFFIILTDCAIVPYLFISFVFIYSFIFVLYCCNVSLKSSHLV